MRLPQHSHRFLTRIAAFGAVGVVVGGLAAPASAVPAGRQPSPAELQTLMKQLDALGKQRKAGKAQYWYVDTVKHKVHVAVLKGLRDATTTGFLATGRSDLITTDTVDSPVVTRVGVRRVKRPATVTAVRIGAIYGGDEITTISGEYQYFCSAGFNRLHANVMSVLTAGHCRISPPGPWSHTATNSTLGSFGDYSFPGGDYGYITPVSGWTQPSSVRKSDGTFQQITTFAKPTLNQSVCKTGRTSGTTCGTVTALNVTVNYPEGTVTGTARTTVHAEHGDSGGSVYATTVGVATVSGGPDNNYNLTFVYPVPIP